MAKENTAKFNELQQTVTDQIIAQLESGDLGLWQKEWLSCGMPENPLSGTKYKGANVIILLMARAKNGYSTNKWTTSAALRKLGHHVLAGNKATLITKPTSFVPIDEDTKVPVSFGCQPVFNLDQTSMEIEPENYEMLGDDNAEADKIIDAMTKDLASVVYNGDQAYYRRATDLRISKLPAESMRLLSMNLDMPPCMSRDSIEKQKDLLERLSMPTRN